MAPRETQKSSPRKRAEETGKLMGERLREVRLSRGMTLEQVALFLGISYQQVQKYEKGDNSITAERLKILARTLGVTPNYLLDVPETDSMEAALAHKKLMHLMLRLHEIERKEPDVFAKICKMAKLPRTE